MLTNWVLNTIGLFATTVAALLMFLHLRSLPRTVEELQTAEGKRVYAKHHKLATIGVGLLAAWLVIQYLAVILL